MTNNNLSPGWTDDLNIQITGNISLEELVQAIIERFKKYERFDKIFTELIEPNVAEEDQDIVLDRAIGGIVRALTGNVSNKPVKEKDPIAHITFMEAWNSFPKRGFIIKKRKPGGFWEEWDSKRRV